MQKLRFILILTFIYFGQSINAQKLESEFLFEIKVVLDSPIDIGKTPLGKRVIYPVTGGTFEGPKLKGKVLSTGADWGLNLDSEILKLDVRILFETDDSALIYVTYTGFIYKNSDNSTYFRIIPVFETSSEKYRWLNHTIAVGVGRGIKGGVAYRVYAVK